MGSRVNLANFSGDNHNLSVTADGLTIYAAYIARDMADPVNGDRTAYVHRINIACEGLAADLSGDGLLSTEDGVAFTNAYATKDATADLNLDASVSEDDLLLFTDWYNSRR